MGFCYIKKVSRIKVFIYFPSKPHNIPTGYQNCEGNSLQIPMAKTKKIIKNICISFFHKDDFCYKLDLDDGK